MGRHFNDFNQYDRSNPFSEGGRRRQRGGFGPGPGGWGQWGEPGRGHRGGPGGPGMPPPWVTGFFGVGGRPEGRGPRVRRGDVRSAILDILLAANQREESPNGYQVIQQITERSGGIWKPSPGSVYPTIAQLEDEELVEQDAQSGGRAIRLTAKGVTWCQEHADELAAVWVPFDRSRAGAETTASGHADLKAEIGQVMSAVWQIVSAGSDRQRSAAIDVLVEARRSLYGILADGPNPRAEGQDDQQDDQQDEADEG